MLLSEVLEVDVWEWLFVDVILEWAEEEPVGFKLENIEEENGEVVVAVEEIETESLEVRAWAGESLTGAYKSNWLTRTRATGVCRWYTVMNSA